MRLLNSFKRKADKLSNKIRKQLGNPGFALYVKKEYYKDAIEHLEQSNKFHDLNRTKGVLELSYKNFEYKKEITHCDFSKELLKDEDVLILIWCVDKGLQKNK